MNLMTFYQHRGFEGERARLIHRDIPRDNIEILPGPPTLRRMMTAFFDEVSFERSGFLRGEYVIDTASGGLILIDRTQLYVIINCAWEDIGSQQILSVCNTPTFFTRAKDLVDQWDSLPVTAHNPIIGHPYVHNYFHFTFDVAANLRFYNGASGQPLIAPAAAVARPFQAEILGRASKGRPVHVLESPLRVIDPYIVSTFMSAEAIHYIRDAIGLQATPGKRKVYIYRQSVTRSGTGGGAIIHTPEFLEFLRQHGFETIDFGRGDTPVAQQIEMLNGTNVVLSSHGANMTNLAFLARDVNVIEIASYGRAHGYFAYLSAVLGFRYFGLPHTQCDANGDIVPDVGALSQVMSKIG